MTFTLITPNDSYETPLEQLEDQYPKVFDGNTAIYMCSPDEGSTYIFSTSPINKEDYIKLGKAGL